jgi:hypothetical protein
MPLVIAMRDPRFSFTRCFEIQRVVKKEAVSLSTRENSKSGNEDFPSYRESQTDVHYSEPLAPVVRQLSAGKIARLRHVPLVKFLTFPAGKEAFREFTVREFSVENLLFVEAVKTLNDNPAPTKADCKAIYDQYVASSGANQVNLPSVVVQRLEARLDDAEPGELGLKSYFDESYAHVMKLMQRDAFKRFQNTTAWQTHVVVFDAEPKAETVPQAQPEGDKASSTVPLSPVSSLVEVPPSPRFNEAESAPASTTGEATAISPAPAPVSGAEAV